MVHRHTQNGHILLLVPPVGLGIVNAMRIMSWSARKLPADNPAGGGMSPRVHRPYDGARMRASFDPGAARGLLLVVCLAAATAGMCRLALAADHDARLEDKIAFDIPPQPLASALKAYGAVASVELFFETGLTVGRVSAPVRGVLTRNAALRMMLAGTGLAAESFDPGTVTILPARGRGGPVDLTPVKARAVAFTPYFALLQTSLRSSLCQIPATRTDPSELRVRLWIAPSGAVMRTELLSSTGNEDRDRAYVDALRTLAIGEPPPPSMPQPVTLMILPRTSAEAAECLAAAGPASPSMLPVGAP